MCLVVQARLGLSYLSRERCSNTHVALCFSGCGRPNAAIIPLSGPLERPHRSKGLCKRGGVAIYSGVFRVSLFSGVSYRTRLDRNSQDSGPQSHGACAAFCIIVLVKVRWGS